MDSDGLKGIPSYIFESSINGGGSASADHWMYVVVPAEL